MGIPRRVTDRYRTAAFAVLVLQLLLAALPHSERLSGGEHRIGAATDQSSVRHAAGCQACVVGQAPGSPVALSSLDMPAIVALPPAPAAPAATHFTGLILHYSRAPPTTLL